MPKNSNSDFNAGLSKLVQDSHKRRENNIGKTILDTHITPNYTEKQSVLIDIARLYASPKKWNFYEPLDDNKKLELMESIQDNGVLSPIIVWKVDYELLENEYADDEIDVYDFQGNEYLILAGHNRADAINKLRVATEDEKYLKIPAFVFDRDELDLSSAREIVVDTNYIQRVLNTKEMEMSILYKYDEIEKDKTRKGRTRDLVAAELGISPAKVEQYRKLSKLIQPIKEMMYDDKLALNSVLKIVDKSEDIQQWIYDTYKDVLSNKLLNKVKPYMKRLEIEKLFEKELEPKIKKVKVAIEIPEELVDEFKEMAYQWVYNKTKR